MEAVFTGNGADCRPYVQRHGDAGEAELLLRVAEEAKRPRDGDGEALALLTSHFGSRPLQGLLESGLKIETIGKVLAPVAIRPAKQVAFDGGLIRLGAHP